MRVERLDNKLALSDTEWIFPSWTWLSSPGGVIFEPAAAGAPSELRPTLSTVNDHVRIVDWQVSWQGHPFASKLKSTRLIVEGPVQELFIEIPAEAKHLKPPYCIINHKAPRGPEHPIPRRSTVQFDREEWKPAKTWTCLLLQSATYNNEQKKHRDDTFILVERLSSGLEFDTFRRVGIGVSRDDNDAFSSTVQRTLHMV
jgi:hypothetical protein